MSFPRILSLKLGAAALLAASVLAGEATTRKPPPKADKPQTPYEKFLEKGRLREFPARDWKQAFAYNSVRYRVRTNTASEVGEYVGRLMDAIHYHYRQRFGASGTRKANINVFRTHKEMAVWARRYCKYTLKPNTIGFYSTRSGGTICVVWKKLKGQHPQTVLMHEGSHQFVSAVWGSRTFPIWLNEGFAVYFENSHFDGRKLDTGRIPVARLRRLQKQMAAGEHVTLAKLFAIDRKKFTVDCYGSAWALVFWLAHSGDEQTLRHHQAVLSKFGGDCRRGRRDGKRLAAYLGLTMEQFEKKWKDWVLKLDPKDPYGGVRKKAAPRK